MQFSFEQGDFVFHEKYGIGKFHCIENISLNNTESEFLKIEYSNNSFVYIPIYKINIIKFHSSKNNINAKIDELGKSRIAKKRAKLEEELAVVAKDLLELAAARELLYVDSFSLPSNYSKFDQEAPFKMTICQEKAFNEIMEDLSKNKPMDRLLCADVGFGKTELALRSAFVVASAKKKVVFIVPTVILATQHYQLFKERLSNFGINCELLSRLNPNSDIILKNWKNGLIDILITTSNKNLENLCVENLSLIILDEEHHFGVKFKESIKEKGHFLQLSATPIPRTLNMALSKIKNISSLDLPPCTKNNINMHILHQEDADNLEQIIHNEVNENGRVFLVVPRISYIVEVQKILDNFENKIDYTILHGKLNSTEIDTNLQQFKEGIKPIIIGTTIIESGLNIIQANMMVIFSAHMFGIAQLHQLRGRIGRGDNSHATIYLIVPKVLKDLAKDRIYSLQEHNFLGAGYALAMHDISARGAGTVLGYKQSGKHYGFGVEFYYEMLEKALGKAEQVVENIEFEGFNAKIPKTFISDENIRINFYKKLTKIKNLKELDFIEKELSYFGNFPDSLSNFFVLMKWQYLAKDKNIKKIIKQNDNIKIVFGNGMTTKVLENEMEKFLNSFDF